MTKEKSTHGLGILWIALALLFTWSALALAGGVETKSIPGKDSQGVSGGIVDTKPIVLPSLKIGPRPVYGPDDFGPPNSLDQEKLKKKLFIPKSLPNAGGVETKVISGVIFVPGGSDDRIPGGSDDRQ